MEGEIQEVIVMRLTWDMKISKEIQIYGLFRLGLVICRDWEGYQHCQTFEIVMT